MSTIAKTLSATRNQNGEAEIALRITNGRKFRCRVKSGIFIDPTRFVNGRIKMPRMMTPESEKLQKIQAKLDDLDNAIHVAMFNDPNITKEDIENVIHTFHHPQKAPKPKAESDFFSLMGTFIENKDIVQRSKQLYYCLARALHRFELYRKATDNPRFKLTVANFDSEMLAKFVWFYRNEHTLYSEYPDIYTDFPVAMRPQHREPRPAPRGDNMISAVLRRISTFYSWLIDEGLTDTKPTSKYQGVKTEKYGTPIYLTKAERNLVANFDLSSNPHLAKQRDVFIFQCHIGCRISDLYSMDRSNIIDGHIEYIPAKTKKDKLNTVRVPLTSAAKAILDRYADCPTILPFISQQRYNDTIKDVLKACGVNRIVTIINPTTGKDERKPIWEVASSHMARRTFIGNLYKMVKDPNLIGALSGHTEGSKAFIRYREIDDEIRRDVMDFVE